MQVTSGSTAGTSTAAGATCVGSDSSVWTSLVIVLGAEGSLDMEVTAGVDSSSSGGPPLDLTGGAELTSLTSGASSV